MRKLIVSEFVTLDGVMQAPGGKDEDRDGGFEHGGWTMRAFDLFTRGRSEWQLTPEAKPLIWETGPIQRSGLMWWLS
jgi:hypothetical protein